MVDDVAKDRRFGPVSGLGYRRLSAVSVPIDYQREFLGVLTLASPKLGAFSETDRLAVEALAATVGLGLRCKRYQEAETRNFLGTISGLATALEAKDSSTRGHSARVAHLCHSVGMELAMGSAEIRQLEIAASLHDIGKIGVPESILNKPGPLTVEEARIVQQHVVVGSEMLAEIPALQYHAPIVRAHHERLDGEGYPDGLTGEAIPLESRIIAVADALDAMVMARPYRKTRSPRAALAEIRRCVGTQFDPLIAEALANVIEGTSRAHFLRLLSQ